MGGQRLCTKHVSGLVSIVSLWNEIVRKLRLKRRKMEMIVGEKGIDLGGQGACSKHVSGLVSNMLRCGVKCSGNCGCRGCRWRRSWGKRGYTCGFVRSMFQG